MATKTLERETVLTGVPLEDAMELLNGVIERRATIPILSHVKVVADGERLAISGTDLDTLLEITLPHRGAKFQTCPPAQSFTAAAVLTELDLDAEGAELMVGRSPLFKLPCLPADDFPRMRFEEPQHTFSLPAEQLAADLVALSTSISTEETRYYLNGICMKATDADLRMFATDGHKLVRVVRPLPEGAEGLRESIVPRRAVKLLAKAITVSDADVVKVEIAGLKARFTFDNVVLLTKLIDGTYPDVERVIPPSHGGTFTLKAADGLKLCDAAAVALGGQKAAIEFNFAKELFRASSPGEGEVSADLPGSVTGKLPDRIGFNCGYFRKLMEMRPNSDWSLDIIDEAAPVALRCEDPALFAVLMPLRLSCR